MAPLQARPGVAAIVFDAAGSVLLHRRRIAGGWAPPSGTLEPGEAILDALQRELREETALEVDIERLVGVYSDPAYQVVCYPDGGRVQFVTCLFTCRVTGGQLQGSKEGLEWRWCPVDALPEGLLPYAEIWLRDALGFGERVEVR